MLWIGVAMKIARVRKMRKLPHPGPHRDTLIALGLMLFALGLLAVAMIVHGAGGG
jgi:hypothetical protein